MKKCKECGKIFENLKRTYCCDFCRLEAKKERDRKLYEEKKEHKEEREKKMKINPMFLVRGEISNLRCCDSFQYIGMN